jgi:hypothetical protein
LGQLTASIALTVVGAVYLFYSIRIADAVVRANVKLNRIFFETNPRKAKIEPSKFSYLFGRAIALIQAVTLFGFGVRGLIHNFFGI